MMVSLSFFVASLFVVSLSFLPLALYKLSARLIILRTRKICCIRTRFLVTYHCMITAFPVFRALFILLGSQDKYYSVQGGVQRAANR